MAKDIKEKYREETESEKLDLWLGHPELRDEFDEMDHSPAGARQAVEHGDKAPAGAEAQRDLAREYMDDSESEKLDLWLAHPELREEFNDIDHMAGGTGPQGESRGGHFLKETLDELEQKVKSSVRGVAADLSHALHLDKKGK